MPSSLNRLRRGTDGQYQGGGRAGGVSTTTVSHVINETRFVAEETRERVFAAMRDLNLCPRPGGPQPQGKETNSIGMLVTTSSNPFFAEVVRGVERYCFEQGYNLMLGNTEGTGRDRALLPQDDAQKRVDGLLIMCSEAAGGVQPARLAPKSLPVVVMDWGMENGEVDLIADNSHRGYLATRHLLGLGHTAIGCITGPTAAPRPTSARRVSSRQCRRPGSPSIRAGSGGTLTAPAPPP